jgi:hypothetical protein
MACNIQSLHHFDNRFKRFAKKFKTLTNELIDLVEELSNDPKQGKSLGAGLYKIRLVVKVKVLEKVGVLEL